MAAMTMKKTLGDLVKREFSHDYCRETVTLVAQPGGYPMGAVLGKDLTTGKFAFSPATAAEPADGTEVACAFGTCFQRGRSRRCACHDAWPRDFG